MFMFSKIFINYKNMMSSIIWLICFMTIGLLSSCNAPSPSGIPNQQSALTQSAEQGTTTQVCNQTSALITAAVGGSFDAQLQFDSDDCITGVRITFLSPVAVSEFIVSVGLTALPGINTVIGRTPDGTDQTQFTCTPVPSGGVQCVGNMVFPFTSNGTTPVPGPICDYEKQNLVLSIGSIIGLVSPRFSVQSKTVCASSVEGACATKLLTSASTANEYCGTMKSVVDPFPPLTYLAEQKRCVPSLLFDEGQCYQTGEEFFSVVSYTVAPCDDPPLSIHLVNRVGINDGSVKVGRVLETQQGSGLGMISVYGKSSVPGSSYGFLNPGEAVNYFNNRVPRLSVSCIYRVHFLSGVFDRANACVSSVSAEKAEQASCQGFVIPCSNTVPWWY